MKNLNLWNKFVFLINSVFALLLLVGYLLPYYPPKIFPPIAVLTLIIPVLIAVNLGFAVYWLLLFKRQMLLSILVLGLWMLHNTTLYKIESGTLPAELESSKDQISLLTYNAHVFRSESFSRDTIQAGNEALVSRANPDIVCYQEFSNHGAPDLNYPYHYFGVNANTRSSLQAIYSKYKIINQGSLDFESTFNNAIFVDIVKKQDTLRIYNMHMQSLALTPELGALEQENTKSLVGRLGRAFKKQEDQVELFLEHQAACPYKKIVAGDFNNTVFSYTYNKIKGEKTDAFAEQGSGFGRTFIFDIIPLRIDFILSDPEFKVRAFENFDVTYSDHFPIIAVLEL
ncbi:MAG: endonuclease/exonuclease/phosphatase family protein [Bacteroidota bacterium]|nr:endonuclease/exonuclease/phosphatase family protein [Bacteroidota bacterium]MEE3146881.1 endonuclease/exonuclease/phosphatase family protein [Bacteroidota bacterium]